MWKEEGVQDQNAALDFLRPITKQNSDQPKLLASVEMRKVWKELLSGYHQHEVETATEPCSFLHTVPPNIVVKKQEKEEKIRKMNASGYAAVDP